MGRREQGKEALYTEFESPISSLSICSPIMSLFSYVWCYCICNGESNASEQFIHVIMVRRRQRTLSVHRPLWEYFGVDREKYYGAEVDELKEE